MPLIVKDPEVTEWKGAAPTEPFVITSEDVFLDGPITPRVAVLDFDERTGQLHAGVRFVEPPSESEKGIYSPSSMAAAPGEIVPRETASVSVFGTVLKTMAMFEEPDAIGRPITWAFDAPQLLVVPRAGEWANAFYERESHSLQFFYFTAPDGRRIHTSHSQDIVAHETAHAILDGIAPDLYHSISPQALAIHEAVADLTALLCAFRSRSLSEQVLQETGGSIARSSAFTGIAEQFAAALMENRPYLRDLLNNKSLKPGARRENRVDRAEPHAVSEVLSGALYSVMVKVHESLKDEYAASPQPRSSLVEPEESAYQQLKHGVRGGARETPGYDRLSEPARRSARELVAMKALFVGAERFKRTLYRGLDYLPPGDVSLADLGRAILAADQASHPDSEEQREWICEEFVRRGIVQRAADLRVKTNFPHPAVAELDLPSLVESDWAAYQFANANRSLLRIPKDVPFEVRPRLDVTKLYWHRDGKHEVRECLFKVSWIRVERNGVGHGLPRRRRITMGTTLAIDWETRTVRARLTSEGGAADRAERDRLLATLIDTEVLRLGDEASGADGLPLAGRRPGGRHSGCAPDPERGAPAPHQRRGTGVSDTLRVRMYNVRFGDAILVTVPDRHPTTHVVTTRRILIDVGNAPLVASPEGGDDSVFKPVVEDIINEVNGDPIDLYVMTHEHLDHAQGLPHAAWKSFPDGELATKLPVRYAWLTASAHEDYYDTHPDAKKLKLAFLEMYDRIERHLQLEAADRLGPYLRFLSINNPASTKECVKFLRTLATKKTSYVHRSVGTPADGTPLFKVAGTHPFKEARFEIWAPEEDTSGYYGKFQPLSVASPPLPPGEPARRSLGEGGVVRGQQAPNPLPPSGVDAGAFYNLVEARLRGIGDNILAIDKAANNTSVVFLLQWRGWRLLFAGDAEVRSWKTMNREGVLKPVHFLKVSHHGSHNGTPEDDLFEAILPEQAPDNRTRTAAISTWTDTYPGIPHDPTDTRLKSRCDFHTTLDDPDELFFEVEFEG